ncbi:MAG: T9SS type A sorting domain-containing protein [Crocinitomix sp.]|nr:T9SS type A sorting domain-containing protein [Crocinitomix sp.]
MKWIYLLLCLITINGFGQFDIGETSIVFTDTERDRDIETFIYYPADEAGEDVDVTDGKFPVIAVGHGFVMTYESYAYIWEHFVPLGYIVILPNTETTVDVSHGDFGTDLGFVIEALQNENTIETSLFYEHVSVYSAVVGHSMGGGAAVLAAADFPEISTLVTLAAAETDPSAIDAANDVSQPSLTFAGEVDCVTPPADHQELIYNNLSDCKGYVLIFGGTHCQFANSNILCELGEFSCPDTETAESEQHFGVLAIMTPWLRAYLKTDFEAWEEVVALEGENDIFDFNLDCADNAPVLSLENLLENKGIIYPNPTSGEIQIPANYQNKPYHIYSADGRLVQEGITNTEIDLSKLDAGFYSLSGLIPRGLPRQILLFCD